MTKTYSSKSNAARAFRTQFPTYSAMTTAELATEGYIDDDGPNEWVINDPAECQGEDEFEAGAAAELAERKRIADEEEARVLAEHPMARVPAAAKSTEAKPATGARAKSGSSNGLKIEKDREARNGVTRPSVGGKCRGIWDALDTMGTEVTAKDARATLVPIFDKTTVMVQFYRWRKFNGIEGRQA